MTLLPLDIVDESASVLVRSDELYGDPGSIPSVVASIMEADAEQDANSRNYAIELLHRACAVAYLVEPSIFSGIPGTTHIEAAAGVTKGLTTFVSSGAEVRSGSSASTTQMERYIVLYQVLIEPLFSMMRARLAEA